ncbi:9441_t:CDS:1, partial [Funneliformis geosporum]
NNKNFSNTILDLKTNSQHSKTIYGSCMTMQAHFNYLLSLQDEKYCHVTKVIEKYMQ